MGNTFEESVERRLSSVLIACIGLAAACGGDTQGDGGGATGGTGAGGQGGSSASGGSGASGGSSGSGASAGWSGAGGYGVELFEVLGKRCSVAAECQGALCLRFDSDALGGEGPPKGLCTVECTEDPGACDGLKGAQCLPLTADKSYCVRGCSYGPEGIDIFNPAKCFGRPEMACTPTPLGDAVCLPRCNSDSDCEDLHCNPRTGLCTTNAPVGTALGEPCAAPGPGGSDTCQGECAPEGYCSQGCTASALPACGWDGSGPAPAGCVVTPAPVLAGGGPAAGDFEYCARLCDCDGDCGQPSLVCQPWPSQSASKLATHYERKGQCAPASAQAPGTPCP